MSTPLTTPHPAPTASAVNTMRIQWTSAAMVWVARVVAQTLERATIAPTDRSMPPPPMTKVIPTLTTPMTEARRRIVIMLSTLAKRSPAVMTPTTHRMTSAMTRPRLRPADPASRPAAAGALRRLRGGGALVVAARQGVGGRPGGRPAALGLGGLRGLVDAHAASPLMMMSSTWCSSSWSAGASWSTDPSPTTRTRSERPSTSSISLDTTTTATPSSARRRTRA